MAVQIALAVRSARERVLGNQNVNVADDEVLAGSRAHRALTDKLTVKATMRMLEEGAHGDAAAPMGNATSTNSRERAGSKEGSSFVFAVRPQKLLTRMDMEYQMINVAMKMPLFLICMVCFIWAISLLSPAESISKVHQQLIGHFDVSKDRFDTIGSFSDIYDFILSFESANRELQATSAKYWCEKRYFEHSWNDALGVPERSCPSPRLDALGFQTDTPTKWSAWKAAQAPASSSSSSASPAPAASGHRRLLKGRGLSEPATHSSTGGGSAGGVPPCEDDDKELQAEEGDLNMTCNNSASHVCEIDLGITLCPKTCGYCAPFEYEHSVYFDRPQVTLLPVMVHQTRFPTKECEHFAHTFEMQPFNRDLKTMPPLDGERLGRVLTCIDRTKHLESEYAFELECPKVGAPEKFCQGGVMKDTKIHYYHGEPVYAKFLTEPTKNINAMREVGWVDLQTEQVVVSTLVYTEGVEIFTSISAVFKMDPAGNIVAHNSMISYTDLTRSQRTVFIVLMVIVCVGSFGGVVINGWQLWKSRSCKWGLQAYELFSRSVMCVYALVLLLTWMKQVPMAEEYDSLLRSVLDMNGHGPEEFEELVQTYFDGKTMVYYESQWLMSHRIAIYIILYIQFAQLIAYFAVHPRLAMLTSTIAGALDHMFHFFMLFAVITLMLAFMASWMLGGDVHAFQTFGEAVASQGKMLFGEWIYADNADDLHGWMVAMYWLYAITFMLVLFFTLLNFFLAIVVEAFVVVKGNIVEDSTEQNIVYDISDLLRIYWRFKRHQWGSHAVLTDRLREAVAEEEVWHVRKLLDIMPPKAQNAHSLAQFLHYYACKSPSVISTGVEANKLMRQAHEKDVREHCPKTASLNEAFKDASAILTPALKHSFQGVIGDPVWSYEKVQIGSQILHRVSANFARECAVETDTVDIAEMITGGGMELAHDKSPDK
eukprot:CAMPEP_0176071528 /NCGR_PEP_ID=MMETSP0120_2-20121206/35726_1 /TAXON_ID=160619 /ORGANISM="Kryptoperidinium foliaceum, Strain CCMP 1326" /LENGTH=938 /DNA_ID=CAMNT_0017405185 /DNA_START=33 /DNA_END=2849 /DNA_ORIENTATION=-